MVISGHLSISVIPYTFLNIQNRDNTPVKQSTRLSSDDLKRSHTFVSMNMSDHLIVFNMNTKV